MVVQPRLAAAVLLVRDDPMEHGLEVFMVKRSTKSAFLPDVYVFPGGTVKNEDHELEREEDFCAPFPASIADPEERTLLGTGIRVAAIRELFEEANILLAYRNNELVAVDTSMQSQLAHYRQLLNDRQGSLLDLVHKEHLIVATDALLYFAHWITPEAEPRRYDTHFFLAQAPQAQQTLYDPVEASDGVWIGPKEALLRSEQGTFPLAFPTIHQLHALSEFPTVRAAWDAVPSLYVHTHQPVMIEEDGKTRIVLPMEAGPE
jgi:8-oxo-dGTP pyrophosphatase MutT (NUDIX family)